MLEWVAVALCGALGGLLNTFLRGGMDIASPPLIERAIEGRPLTAFAYHLLRNIVFGATASLGLWMEKRRILDKFREATEQENPPRL